MLKIKVLKLKFKKLSENSVLPKYTTVGDAGMDLTATRVIKNTLFQVWYNIDIALEIPKGYFGMICPRSSISNNGNLSLANSLGIIDSNYRGSIQLRFNRTLKGFFTRGRYKIGDRIGQLLILKYTIVKPEEVEELSETERGEGAFGSTGK
jgi:dUTP pyrophosphatase